MSIKAEQKIVVNPIGEEKVVVELNEGVKPLGCYGDKIKG